MSLQCCARHKNCKMASPRCNEFIVPAKQNTCVPTPITFLTEIVSNGVHHIHNIANSLHLPRRLHIYKLQTHGNRSIARNSKSHNDSTPTPPVWKREPFANAFGPKNLLPDINRLGLKLCICIKCFPLLSWKFVALELQCTFNLVTFQNDFAETILIGFASSKIFLNPKISSNKFQFFRAATLVFTHSHFQRGGYFKD